MDQTWWQERAFDFTDRDFNTIRRVVKQHTGIALADSKRDLVYNRLVRRLRALALPDFQSYCALITAKHSEEMHQFINAITTNLTAFFREPHHFDFLRNKVLPALSQKKAGGKIRIWSAGCSTGEEPYSIAMVVKEYFTGRTDIDVKILATDLDSDVLQTAQAGIYGMERVSAVGKARLERWFQRGKCAQNGKVRACDELREMITFNQLNLMHEWPMKGPMDVIFCRNVVIYFDKPTQAALANRYADLLSPDGHLFLGHSETLYRVTTRLRSIGNTVYQKVT